MPRHRQLKVNAVYGNLNAGFWFFKQIFEHIPLTTIAHIRVGVPALPLLLVGKVRLITRLTIVFVGQSADLWEYSRYNSRNREQSIPTLKFKLADLISRRTGMAFSLAQQMVESQAQLDYKQAIEYGFARDVIEREDPRMT